MRNTAISWKRNQHLHVFHRESDEIQYISIDRYIHEESPYCLTNIYTSPKFSIFQLHSTVVTNPAVKLQNIKRRYN